MTRSVHVGAIAGQPGRYLDRYRLSKSRCRTPSPALCSHHRVEYMWYMRLSRLSLCVPQQYDYNAFVFIRRAISQQIPASGLVETRASSCTGALIGKRVGKPPSFCKAACFCYLRAHRLKCRDTSAMSSRLRSHQICFADSAMSMQDSRCLRTCSVISTEQSTTMLPCKNSFE